MQNRTEKLIQFIETQVPAQRGRSFLTLSHELNYLLAFHTEFDMLLPEGFSLHSHASNQEITNRMVEIAAFLKIPAERWNYFLRPQHPEDQSLWGVSRMLSAQAGFLYYLYHRYSVRADQAGAGNRQADILKKNLLTQIQLNPTQLASPPDYILEDEVLRFFKLPLPDFYEKIYDADGLALYRNREAFRHQI